MCSPVAGSKILYRNSRLLRMAFLQLHRQQRTDVFCDVILQAEGEAVPAHCCILSACSPFFMECLERQMPSKGCKVVLELRGLKIGTLRKLVDFLYTSEMEVSREEARDVLAAARQFQVAELESLQLEGGKLVKQVLGRRLNRKCLQPPSLVPISARVVPQACPPTPTPPPTFHPPVTGKQRPAKPPGVRASSTTSQAECAKCWAAVVPQNGGAPLGMQGAAAPVQPAETGNVGSKSHSLGLDRSLGVGSTLGKAEGSHGERRAEQAFPREGCTPDCSPLPKKIKLSRLKLPPPPNACATNASPTAAPGKTPTSIRRLWRQKTPGWDEAGRPEQVSPSCHAGSLPAPPKTSTRKRSSSASASGSDTAPEEGHVVSVKLRKVVNGSCWEVVQEPPAREPQGAPVITRETSTSRAASPLSSRAHDFTRWPEPPGTQAAASSEPPAGRLEAGVLPEQVTVEQGPSDGRGSCRDPYELDMALEPLSESEEFGNSAPLEQMLDLLLSDGGGEGPGPGPGPAGPGGTAGCAPSMGPCGPNMTPRGAAAAGEEEWHPLEVQLWPEWDDPGKGPLPGWEVGDGHSILSTADGDPVGQPVGGHFAPGRVLSSGHHPTSCSPVLLAPSSPPTSQPLLLAAGSREAQWGPLPCVPAEGGTGKGQGPCTIQAAGTEETTPQLQAPWGLPRCSPKHGPLDHQPPDSPEEEEIDIMAGAEEALVPAGIICVRPDPSSESDEEVDVLN